MKLRSFAGLGAALALLPCLAFADDAAPAAADAATAAAAAAPAAAATVAAVLNSGDTAWMLTSMALVLFMTIPGLALFYSGLVRSKNVLSVMMQCFAITALVTILWALYGYSMAFDTTGMEKGVININSFVGSLAKAFMGGIKPDTLWQPSATVPNAIPEFVFMSFQMTFAIITPALIVGAFAERMKFSAMLVFMGLWLTVVYAPIAHMVWSGPGSLLGDLGTMDFAGGTVVHINAGVAGLICCLVLGKRKGYPNTPMPPHNLGYTLIGASMLWVGWFGFNAGSAVAANGQAGSAMAATQIATAAAALGWMFAEWLTHGKPSVLGIASGAVAGLVAVTPASGTAGPMGALALGLIAGVGCFLSATKLKSAIGYDDSLDAFGVHAIGGIIGAILTGLFQAPSMGGYGGVDDIGAQLWIQTQAVLFTTIYTAVLTYIILKIVDVVMGLRVSEEDESVGLDLSQHNERGYIL